MIVTNLTNSGRGETIISRCREIAAWTDVPGEITRTFLSPSMQGVHALLRSWMEDVGMTVQVDAIGNLRGLYAGADDDPPRLIVGSHLDTIPNAGAFDGVLGVVLGIALVQNLAGRRLPFAIEVVGFSEEEGVRFSKPFLGSMALTGTLDKNTMRLEDVHGVSVSESIRSFGLDPAAMPEAAVSSSAFAYLEMHIEQGPLLESLGKPLGVVEAIVGQSRLLTSFTGKANHAGTTPMRLRNDALAAAAEWIVAVERIASARDGLVATVGNISALPGAGNVIAGDVAATLDLRHADDAVRATALDKILLEAQDAADRRGVEFGWHQTMDQPAVPMDPELADLLDAAVRSAGIAPVRMMSGAGHDAMIVAARLPCCMLFLRSPGGLSHHPAESVLTRDVSAALAAGMEFLKLLEEKYTNIASRGRE
ncbi:MAG: amidase, hydantoinase/carbamoylase family [Acidobacteriaceae bacterium]|nr:amidase, hydantoinase/carbamoylase family [Acidobacteriaceae bacterium]